MFTDADHHDAQLLVDLINSHYLGDGSDVLAGTGAGQWLHDHIGQHRRMPTASALLPLRELREGLRQLAIGNNSGVPDRAVVARADAALRHAPLVVHLAADGHKPVGPVASAGSAEQAVAAVGMAYLASQGSGAWRRVKACAEPGCRWAFLDLSRNASRRWCDMAGCGNRAKNRSWRARHPSQRY